MSIAVHVEINFFEPELRLFTIFVQLLQFNRRHQPIITIKTEHRN